MKIVEFVMWLALALSVGLTISLEVQAQNRPPLGDKFTPKPGPGEPQQDLLKQQDVNQELQQFKQNSKQYMSQRPAKYGRGGKIMEESPFSQKSQDGRSYIDSKVQWRQQQFPDPQDQTQKPGQQKPCQGKYCGFAEIAPNDRPENLVDEPRMITSVREMDNVGLTHGKVDEDAWSGDYWPHYMGGPGARYFDPQFPVAGGNFMSRLQYINSHFFGDIYATGDSMKIAMLSVAEKYDLLTGESNGPLTDHIWSEAKQLYNQHGGQLETWMGYCHGWAPAAYMIQRPKQTIFVRGYDGRAIIKFNPSELKGLASYMWATSQFESRFIGGRCNVKDPRTDPNGRVIDPNCFDTNSGTWHLAVVNQIGHTQREMIMDATYDFEVWNQPVLNYQYVYFNPQTYTYADSLQAATITKDQFTADKFSSYRSLKTAYVVGVAMQVTYLQEAGANGNDVDGPEYDQHRTVKYIYDLELDSNMNIIGGEWYTHYHPDFLWTPTPGAKAMVAEDRGLSERWDGVGQIPLTWKRGVQTASQRGQILNAIVEALVRKSQGGAPTP